MAEAARTTRRDPGDLPHLIDRIAFARPARLTAKALPSTGFSSEAIADQGRKAHVRARVPLFAEGGNRRPLLKIEEIVASFGQFAEAGSGRLGLRLGGVVGRESQAEGAEEGAPIPKRIAADLAFDALEAGVAAVVGEVHTP
jgi:hypothetical protein